MVMAHAIRRRYGDRSTDVMLMLIASQGLLFPSRRTRIPNRQDSRKLR
jgi:hypothetical protein